MKSLAIALFLPGCLFGQYVNKSVITNYDYPEKVKALTRTTVNYTEELEGTIRGTTLVLVARYNEKGEYTYYQTKENGEVTYEAELFMRDNGRTKSWHDKGTQVDSIVSKLDAKGNPITVTNYQTEGFALVSKFQYDKNGNKTVHSVTHSDSIITKKYTYDKENRVTSETEFRKPVKGGKDRKFNERKYVYNAAGLKTMETHCYYSTEDDIVVADTTTFTYNPKNQLVTRIYHLGSYYATYRFAYDANGNEIMEGYSTAGSEDYDETLNEEWTYDSHGYWASYKQISEDGDVGETYVTEYDADGLPVSCTNTGLGTKAVVTWTYEYR